MPNLTHFDDKIRRSSSFRSMTDLEDYLDYASHCRDELQVYYYMQENNICTNNPQFWLAMLNVLKQRCQLKLIIKKLSEIKKTTHIREYFSSNFRHQDFYKILLFEDKLTTQLQQDIKKRKARKRRSIHEYELFSISKIQKKKRKVGGIEIYVDQDCREHYKLQDYSEFFINNMKDEMQARRNEYDRKQQNKPLSFLGMHESNIQKWSFQLIDKNKRNSFYHQQQNKPRESMIFRDGKNDDNNARQSNNLSKRFSISRKSNVNLNLMSQNNPQSGFKTPKETIICVQTPMKNNRYDTSNKHKQVATPVMMSKNLNNDQSLIKACKKSEKYYKKMRHSSSGSQQDITEQFNKQIINTKDYCKENDDDYSFNYPPCMQQIRVNKQQIQLLLNDHQIHTLHNKFEDKHSMNNFNNKESTLDLGCVEWSQVEDDKKMDVEGEIDRQLKQTIFMTQLQTISMFIINENNDHERRQSLYLQSTPAQSMFYQQDSLMQQSLSEINQVQDSTFGVVMCLKSTQTLESIDSNQQNLFTSRKYQQNSNNNSNNLQAFKKERKLFQEIPVQDRTFISNDSNQSQVDLQISRKQNDTEAMSIQGNEQIKQMIDEMDNIHNNNTSRNIVLQTLRKKKISEYIMGQIIRQDERQHGYGTNSQKKSVFGINNGLRLISQEKSYNSQRKYDNNTYSNQNSNQNSNINNNYSKSRERYSSGYFGDFI